MDLGFLSMFIPREQIDGFVQNGTILMQRMIAAEERLARIEAQGQVILYHLALLQREAGIETNITRQLPLEIDDAGPNSSRPS